MRRISTKQPEGAVSFGSLRLSPFIILCATGLFAIFSSTLSKNPVLPLFARDLGATEADIGFIAAASTVVGIFASVPAGALSDIFGRRKVILAGGFVFATAPLLYLLVSGPAGLAAVRIYHGFATAIFGPVALALVADLFKTGRGQSMGWYSSATLIGRSIAPFIGGIILVYAAYRWVYVACAISGILAFYLAWRLPVDNKIKEGGATFGSSLTKLRDGLRDVARSRPILFTSLMDALQYFSYGALETFLPLYAIFVLGLSTVEAGTIFLLQILTTALTKPVMGRLSDRMGRRPLIVAGLMVSALSMLSLGLPRVLLLGVDPGFRFIYLILVGVVYGLALSIVTSSTSAYVSELARAGSYGSALGVLSTIMDIGQSAGPIVTGLIVLAFSYEAAFITVGTILVVGAVCFWVFGPRQPGAEIAVAQPTR